MARKKKSTNFISNVNSSQTNSNKLTKRKRDDAHSFHPNKPNNEEIPLILSLILSKKIMKTYCLILFLILSLIFSNQIMKKKVHIHCFHQTFVFQHLIMVTITLIFIKKKRVRRMIV